MKVKAFAVAALALFLTALPALAGTFPEKPVTAVVPWAAGGGGDIVFRALAAVFPKYANGQPLLIQNIPGAAGVPGIVEFMKAKGDGYTVAHWNGAQTIKTHMSKTPYTATQFRGVANVVNDYFYILAKADSPFKNLKDVVDYAKAKPEELTIGNAGIGGGNYFAEIMFEDFTGITATGVPFQGGGPLITGLMNGQVDISSNVCPEGSPNIKNGQIRILGVFSPERLPAFPDAPTAKEQGIDLVMSQYRGIVAPADTPDETLAQLEEIFRQVVADPEFVKTMNELGSTIEFLPGKEYDKTIARDSETYLEIVKEKKLGDLYK